MKYMRAGDMIEILSKYDPNIPLIVTHFGKDHQYGVQLKHIHTTNYAYFANDSDAEEAIGDEKVFLQIGAL